MTHVYSGAPNSMGGNSNNLYPPNIQNMSLNPPDYDPRRLFPFGLSPIPEVPSELASEVSSMASSPTPSYDSESEAESVHSRSRGSIMYSGSCDSIKSNVTLHGKRSSSESSTETDHDSTEEETEDEQEPPDIPIDNTPIVKVKSEGDGRLSNLSNSSPSPQNTLYNSEVTQVMHQRTFIEVPAKTPEPKPGLSGVERKTLAQWTQLDENSPPEDRSEFPCDMMSGAATASEIFRHLQATRGKQEVTTELAKILTVLKTTLQTGGNHKEDSSSSDEESGLHQAKVKNPMPTGKPPRPPLQNKLKSLSPAIQAKIKELEESKSANPKEEMNLLSKILVHLLCSCKTVAAAQELKGIIKQFKEVAKVAMDEGDNTLELLRSNSRNSSRNSVRRKVRSRTTSGNSNISANSETDSLNTLTPGDSKSSGTDDDIGQDPNIGKIRFTSDVGGGKGNAVESSVSYTLTLPLSKHDESHVEGHNEAEGDEDDEEWEWEYEDESTAVTPTKQGSSGSSRNLTPSDASTGSTRKLLTEMEMGAYNSNSNSHSEQHSTTITEEDEELEDDDEHGRKKQRGSDKQEGHIFCHLEETFKVLSDTYKIITTGNSPEGEFTQDGNYAMSPEANAKNNGVDESFENILDGISNQCVQLETEITRSSRESSVSVRQTPIRQCSASPSPGASSPAPAKQSRPNSRTGSRMSRPGSRLKTKTPVSTGEEEEDWGDEDEWEYYYEGDDWEEEAEGPNAEGDTKAPSRPSSRQRVQSRQTDRPVSRQTDRPVSRPVSRQQDKPATIVLDKPASRPISRQQEIEPAAKVLTRPSSRQLQEVRPASKAASRPVSRAKSDVVAGGGEEDWEWDESGEWADGDDGSWEYEYYYEETTDTAGNVTSRPVSRVRVASRQGANSTIPSKVASRNASRAEEILDNAKALEKGASRTSSRQDIASKPASRVPSRVASRAGEKPPSRAGSRISIRPVSRAKSETGDDAEYEDEWEYYYEEDNPEEDDQSANHNEVQGTACPAKNGNDIPSIVINPTNSQRPGSRGSQPNSRPTSRSGSRPGSRNASRVGKKALGSLGNVEEEGEYYDDYGFDDDDMMELRGSSPTLTTAPTTRATSPSNVFPGEKVSMDYSQQQSITGFQKRRISVIDEVEETTPRPVTVVSRTPTMRGSTTPGDLRAASRTPSFYQSQTGEVGYLNSMAGVSVALAAEYLGQDANRLAASLPADFIEENQVILREKKKKKHRSKEKDTYDEDEDDEEKRRRRKKGRKKDGKFLPKVGVKELAARMEGELFQDIQVGTKMVITKDEARDVIRESKKRIQAVDALEARSQQGTPSRHSPSNRKDEEKRKSVRDMVQLMSHQIPMPEEQCQGDGGYSIAVTSGQPYSIPSISVSSNMPPPVPPLPQGYYTSSPSPQYSQQYQPYPVEVRPRYPEHFLGHESPYQQYPPQQYQQYPQQMQQQYHAYQGFPPPPPPPHYQYPPQQYQQYPQQMQAYPPGYQPYPPPSPQQAMVYATDNSNQKMVVSGGQTTMVNMRSKSQVPSRAGSQRPKSSEMREVTRSPADSEAYGTGSTGSDDTEGQTARIDHDEGGGCVLDSSGNPIKKRHSRLFKLLQDSDYTDSDTESRSDYSRISMKNVEHKQESDIDSVCSGLERTRDKGIDRKHSFRSHKSSNKESDNESVTSSGVERKISPNSMQKNLTTRRFMQLSLKNDYEPSSSELSTPNSPTAVGPDDKGRRRSTSKAPARVWNYHADDFDTHAGVSDDSSYQSLQSLNSFESIYDANAGLEVEEILKNPLRNVYRNVTESPAGYMTASPKTVDMLRNSPKTHSASPRALQDPRATASPKFEQELLELANFPSSPSISLRQLHSHRGFYGSGGK